jgi:gliding motility-associated-like protein
MENKLLYIFIFLPFFVFSQNEGNIWYFGNHAGLDFNSGAPVPLNNGALDTYEGCATISDYNGDLLFYTDGMTVYNKNHAIMPNGTGLLGNISSTQSAIIVKKPYSNTLYYIFTVDGVTGNSGPLAYSVVDMTLNGGLGDITVYKNIILFQGAVEKITAIKHQNGSDFWIVVPQHTTNIIHSYLLTQAGVNTNSVQNIVPNVVSSLGYLKGSPDGTKIAYVDLGNNVEIFDFNNSNGTISNQSSLLFTSVIGFYGLEFSPNSQLLYAASFYSLYQIDLSLPNANAMVNTSVLIATYSGFYTYGALQLAPDERIYLIKDLDFYLSAIENPNLLGIACGFNSNAVVLSSGTQSFLGLPTFYSSIFIAQPPIISSMHYCLGDSTEFTLNPSPDSVLWNFDDLNSGSANTSTLLNPSHLFSETGIYNVSIIAYNAGIVFNTDVLIEITTPEFILGNDTSICNGNLFELDATYPFASYLWQDASSYATYSTESSGEYWVEITDSSGCKAVDAINILFSNLFEVNINGGGGYCIENDEFGDALVTSNTQQNITIDYTNGSNSFSVSGNTPLNIPIFFTGDYTITSVVDDNACIGDFNGSALYYRLPSPIADFSLNPNIAYLGDSRIEFANMSGGNITSLWSFDFGVAELIDSLSFSRVFKNEGSYTILLLVENEFSCKDSIAKTLKILEVEYFIPSAFTPNGDQINDFFTIDKTNVSSFEMKIYDRWGGGVFTSNDVNKAWNGKIDGVDVAQGTYAYRIILNDLNGKHYEFSGNVILIW